MTCLVIFTEIRPSMRPTSICCSPKYVTALHDATFDLTGDGLVDMVDVDELVLNILGTLYGDANLDRTVDGSDFILWNCQQFQRGGWRKGDFNGDAIVAGTVSMLRQTDDTTNTRNHDKREVPLGTDLAGQLDCLKPSLPAKADEKR